MSAPHSLSGYETAPRRGSLTPWPKKEHHVPHDSDSPACAALPHTYWNYYILWCPTHQCYSLHQNTYQETGTDADPVNYQTWAVNLGPFDAEAEVLGTLLQMFTLHWGDHEVF